MNYPPKVEIWRVDLGGGKGHEQERERPAAVWKHLDHIKIAIVIPFTKNLETEKLPYTYLVTPAHKNGLEEESVALIFQIRAVGKRRLTKKIGELGEHDIKPIGDILRDLLKL
ncbi:MAG: type II toxin-antitoxin system PemK/MazF family toxin [Candidatus Micrarchaeota archaeon]